MRPAKPRPDFLLFPHATGRWAKKINGKFAFFGPWEDPGGALSRFLAQKDGLFAPRAVQPHSAPKSVTRVAPLAEDATQGVHASVLPVTDLAAKGRDVPAGLTIGLLVAQFLAAKQRRLDAKEMGLRSFSECHDTGQRLIAAFGADTSVSQLSPEDFGRHRAVLAEKRGPMSLGNEIGRIRCLFRYGFEAGLMEKPMRFGPEFAKPPKRSLRLARAARGLRMFEPDEIKKILAASGPQMKAMILLGLNCGLGNTDVAMLTWETLDLEKGTLDFPRPKTGIRRKAVLWEATIAALRVVRAIEFRRRSGTAENLVFVTKFGNAWVRVEKPGERTKGKHVAVVKDSVAMEFAKHTSSAGLQRDGRGFYALRHTFRTITYDSRGNVTSETDALGRVSATEYGYDRESGAITQIVSRDPVGNQTTSIFANGNLTEVRTPSSTTLNTYTASNLLDSVRVVENASDSGATPVTVAQFHYAGGRVVKTDHFVGQGATPAYSEYVGYDARGNQIYSGTIAPADSSQPNSNLHLVLNSTQFDTGGRPTKTFRTDSTAIAANSSHLNALALGTFGSGSPWLVEPSTTVLLTATKYDTAGRIIETQDLVNNTATSTKYDARGNAIETVEWFLVAGAQLDSAGFRPHVPSGTTDSSLVPMVTRTCYDGNGRAVFTSDPTPQQAFDVAAQFVCNGNETRYDGSGRATQTTRWKGVSITLGPDTGNPLNPSAPTTSVSFSSGTARWNTRTQYDLAGRIERTVDAAGKATVYNYNQADQQTAVTDPLHNTTRYEYDLFGRRSAVIDALQRRTTYDYDGFGRLYKTTFADGTSVRDEFDSRGRRTAHIDQMQRRTKYGYEPITGRLASVTLPAVAFVNTDGGSTAAGNAEPKYEFAYTDRGALRLIKDPKGRVSTFAYDHFGRRTRKSLPDPGSGGAGVPVWAYAYDPVSGLMTSEEDPDHARTTYTYDHGRVVGRSHGLAPNAEAGRLFIPVNYTFSYDAHRRRKSVLSQRTLGSVQEALTTNYLYDDATSGTGRLSEVSGGLNASSLITYGYDEFDRLGRVSGYLTTSNGAPYSLTYEYDDLGRLKGVKSHGATPPAQLGAASAEYTYSYTPTGQIQKIGMPGGVYSWYAYDQLGRVLSLQHTLESQTSPSSPSSTIFDKFTCTRFADGRVKTLT